MNTVKDAIAEGFDQLAIYWSEPTRHGTERTNLTGVSIETELLSWAEAFAKDSGHATVTGAALSRPRRDLTAPVDHEEIFLWGERAT